MHVARIAWIPLVAIALLPAQAQRLMYPHTPKVNQVDDYFGTKVADPYRWLERLDSNAVADWVQKENAVTNAYLDKIPFRDAIKARLTKLWNFERQTPPRHEGPWWFFSKNNGLQNQDVVYIRKGLRGAPAVLIDPNTLSTDGTVALGGLSVSRGGKYAAYSISRSGSDWQELHVMETATRRQLADRITGVKFSGMSWHGNGFYYNRYTDPRDTIEVFAAVNEGQKVYYHAVGTPQSEDRLVHEDKEHPRRMFGVGASDDERFLFLTVSEQGSKGNALYYRDLARGDRDFKPVTESFDHSVSVVDNVGGALLISTDENAPRGKVMRFDPSRPAQSRWSVVIPESDATLDGISSVGGRLIATYMRDAHSEALQFDLKGRLVRRIALPGLCTAGGFGGKKSDRIVFYTVTSFVSPGTIYQYDVITGVSVKYWEPKIDADLTAYETKEVFFPSKDGTKIPMFIVHRKGMQLNGNNPAMLYGYGGFNISLTPSFSISRLIWLENGGVYAMACLRGGGEYGEAWHDAGTKLHKQNVFDDFIAAAEYLIREKYTTPKKLAISGASNGGLLVGAVTNQRPDLFGVALPGVGVMDMLRFQKFTIGWAWVRDYGSSDDPEQFKALYAYSPLHNIRAGLKYPAVLVTTADHDDRVVPAHSFKYIATLQEKYTGDNPILIRIETKAGHGGGKPVTKTIEELTDIYAFTFKNLGVTPRY